MKTLTFLLTIVLMLANCGSPAVDDLGISAKVKSKLAADGETSAIKIGVDTINGEVTLSGVVPTEREKAKAEQLARATEGVRQVVNQITVNPASIGATNAGEKAEEAISDAAILTKVKAKLLAEGLTGTNVDVANGVVTLKGAVENAGRIAQADELARSTNGVKSVNNQLTAKHQ
jgi:osmotically-inducible protein OsmY